MDAMLVSVDAAGRVVIPKQLRERFGLGPNAQLEIEAAPTGLHLRPVVRSRRSIIVGSDGLPLIEPGDGPRSTDADVQRWRDDDHR